MQINKTKRAKKVETEQEQATSTTNAASEDAACCLADIDIVLEENDTREPSNEEILAGPAPDFLAALKEYNPQLHEDYVNNQFDGYDLDRVKDFKREFESTEEYQRYKKAYETSTGMEFQVHQMKRLRDTKIPLCCGMRCCS